MTTTRKRPQDHQPKAAAQQGNAFEVTVRGVDLTIPAERFDDFELLFDMQTIDQGAGAEALPRLIDVFARFLGVTDAKRLIAAAKADGPLGIESGVALINEVFDALKATSAPNS
ncbi:hypothetical protein [Cellulomonas hominis]|uniref:hypothetical protein n=1 Tax=Cellulomonas hominis TaxID=156981 RepID=UPI00144454D1|nr:hypothetical protein [Cellulomonas hominis]NKY08947.1 hypothetical protein [Cellulomonas hominis]